MNKLEKTIDSKRGQAWYRRLVRSIRDWFTGEDARKTCEHGYQREKLGRERTARIINETRRRMSTYTPEQREELQRKLEEILRLNSKDNLPTK